MYNITGWSNGGRRPLSYNLMPGQFRNTRVNVFSNPTIINNNIGGFGGCYDYYDDCCCGGSNKMSWMDWTMMGGMLLNGLGSILSCFWGGGGGGAEKAKADTPDDKTLKTQAKELAELYGVDKKNVSVIDGTIRVNIDGQVIKCEDLEELEEALSGGNNNAGAVLRNRTVVDRETADDDDDNDNDNIATAPTGLGTAWNGVKFGGDDGLQIKKIIDAATTGDINIDIASVTYGEAETGTGIPKKITVKDKDGGEYVFELVVNYNDYLGSDKNGNIRYACTKTPTGSLAADKQQQFDLTKDGTFTQADLEEWQGSKHKLDATATRANHTSDGYREDTFTGFSNISAFPSNQYRHVRVPNLPANIRNNTSKFGITEGMNLDQVLKACGITSPTQDMREAFLKMNQDAFDMTGKLVDISDLDVFITNTKKTDWGISN